MFIHSKTKDGQFIAVNTDSIAILEQNQDGTFNCFCAGAYYNLTENAGKEIIDILHINDEIVPRK